MCFGNARNFVVLKFYFSSLCGLCVKILTKVEEDFTQSSLRTHKEDGSRNAILENLITHRSVGQSFAD